MRRAFALLTAFALVGCTNTSGDPVTPAPALKLVSYSSCDELLSSIREAAKLSVGPYGFGGVHDLWFASGGMARTDAAAAAEAAPQPVQGKDYSGTNTHEQGVDEPDLVKTDGNRIVVVSAGSLHVIDAATKRETHRVPVDKGAYQILMHGDRVLVLSHGQAVIPFDGPALRMPVPYRQHTQVQLIDIGGIPKVVGEFKIQARLIDARQVGSTARIVVGSTPSIEFPAAVRPAGNDDTRIAANRQVIDKAPIDAWLPAITVNGERATMDCSDVSLPRVFSGASMVTLLSFDLAASTLSEGEPVAVAADGETVYGSGTNLYLAHDDRWRGWRPGVWDAGQLKETTELYQFDITSPRPVYVASGSVPGWLLNQYSMSEFDGVLRVATTNTAADASSVYTLRRQGGSLRQLGHVGGLGKDERIYAVRFVGKVGYVVTFRQTDPLYTLDLGDPRRPRVVGELKIPGYSAYLHPVGDARLIGVGQDATDQGRTLGTQVSLFDVGNLADPARLDQFKISRAYSEAEYDPHAFLYWPAAKLLVIPVNMDALLLRVEDSALHQVGKISHDRGYEGQIRRSLVIGDTLWTISQLGALASTLDGERELAWVSL